MYVSQLAFKNGIDNITWGASQRFDYGKAIFLRDWDLKMLKELDSEFRTYRKSEVLVRAGE